MSLPADSAPGFAANPVTAFEIPAADLERAMQFYGAVFGFRLEVDTVDGNRMAWFPHSPGAPGISGALVQGDSYVPGRQGARLYFYADDIPATLARVQSAGGRVLYPHTAVGELGWVAEFADSEGNCIGLHTPARLAAAQPGS